jgi:hypothetical protein
MKTYTKKNGEITDYDQKKYNKTYYEKNKEKKAVETYTCNYCNKEEIIKRNKYNHDKTLKHKLYVRIAELAQPAQDA